MGLVLAALALPAVAQKDAAEKVQEGNVGNWVEYYKRQRETPQPPPSTGSGASQSPTPSMERAEGQGSPAPAATREASSK